MAKTGRNNPCPCGSGKKYKQCCLAKDEAAERAMFVERAAAQTLGGPGFEFADLVERLAAAFPLDNDDELIEASNGVVDLIHAGKLDEAERAAHDLLERFPHVHDGYDRLGMVYEARGDNRKAAEYYRKVIAFARERPDLYDAEFEAVFQEMVDKLDPPGAEQAP
jgi:tetratricopeptide (TPR) repeat protein